MATVHRNKKDLKKNGSGVYDPTAWKAISKVDKEAQEKYDCVMEQIERICEKAGFEILDAIILKDKKSGRVWR